MSFFRERDISDIDQSHALQSLVAMETLKRSQISEETITSLICCPVRNERSANVIGKSLMDGSGHDTVSEALKLLLSHTVGLPHGTCVYTVINAWHT